MVCTLNGLCNCITYLRYPTADAHLIPGMPACVPLGLSDHFWVYWIPILTCESLLCALALYRAFSGALIEPLPDARDKNGTRRGQSVFMRRLGAIFRNGQRIVDVLIRDSILFFLVYVSTALFTSETKPHP